MMALIAALLLGSPDAASALALPGTVTVVMANPDATDSGGDRSFADAVGQALGEASFTLMPQTGHSRYIAEVSVAHEGKGVVATKAPTDKASAAIGSWGPAVSVPLGSKKTQLHDLVMTSLTVRLVEVAGRRPVWTGSAVTVRPDGSPGTPLRLARAVVSAYPHALTAPVSVP